MSQRPAHVLVVGASGASGAAGWRWRSGTISRRLRWSGTCSEARGSCPLSRLSVAIGAACEPGSGRAGNGRVVLTHDEDGRPDTARRIDDGGVANVLHALGGRRPRIVLMTSIYVARR